MRALTARGHGAGRRACAAASPFPLLLGLAHTDAAGQGLGERRLHLGATDALLDGEVCVLEDRFETLLVEQGLRARRSLLALLRSALGLPFLGFHLQLLVQGLVDVDLLPSLHAHPHRPLRLDPLPYPLLAVLLEAERIQRGLKLRMQPVVHEIAVHIRLQKFRADELLSTHLFEVVRGDKLVVIENDLFRALFELFRNRVEEGAPCGCQAQRRREVDPYPLVVVRGEEHARLGVEDELVDRELALDGRGDLRGSRLPDLHGSLVRGADEQVLRVGAPGVEGHGTYGEAVHVVPL
mmetsp:Transcript_85609/g.247095  ORF Transcript_85609/g.247095 Transcript_85609/m.247095 type:complete len:295 (+) Transcript_85609:140-1024(+)